MVVSWETTFMNMATQLASNRSPDERLKVGCIIVNENNRIAGIAYNGFLNGAASESILRDGHEQATVHAEINAIINCILTGSSTVGCTAYITHHPCLHCAKTLWQGGIRKIIYENDYKNDPLICQIIPDSDFIEKFTPQG